MQFDNIEARAIDTQTQYGVIISGSVFQYFKDLDYARVVVEKMFAKARKKVAIFDINDAAQKEHYEEARTSGMSQQERQAYKQKYEKLDHLFYSKDWFRDLARELGAKLSIYEQNIAGYKNTGLRFNVIMEK
ncbi:MAG: hypothetical protein ACTTIC_06855 [Helicobacteraceae bacterium]